MGEKVTKSRKSSKAKPTSPDAGASTTNDAKSQIGPIPAEAEESRHLDQIRDIIFGKQMVAYEERFGQLEKRIAEQIDTLRRENEERLNAMQETIKQSNDDFSTLLKNEQSDRGREGKSLSQEIVKVQKALTAAIDALADRQEKDISSLSEKMSVLSSELSDEMYIQQVEAAKQLEEAVRQLDEAKVARKALSQMLTDMAGRLAGERE